MFLAGVRRLSEPELSGARHRDDEDAPRPLLATFIFSIFLCGRCFEDRMLAGLDYFRFARIREYPMCPQWGEPERLTFDAGG
jgi:hypothetical protein